MSQRLKKNKTYLRLLLEAHKAQQKALLRTINVEQLKTIGEIALNILGGVVPLTPSQKKALTRYRNIVRLLADKKTSQRKKKISLEKNIKALKILLKVVEPFL